jgi:hypothetical protein
VAWLSCSQLHLCFCSLPDVELLSDACSIELIGEVAADEAKDKEDTSSETHYQSKHFKELIDVTLSD